MSYSEDNTFEKIMDRALSNPILDLVDKRQGSIIYDALAPMALELSNLYIQLDVMDTQTYLISATGQNLDKKAYDYGVTRKDATKAKRIGEFKKDVGGTYVDMAIPVGTRFAVADETLSLTYKYIGEVDGDEILECEQAGTQGNTYSGTILPLTPVSGMAISNIIGTLQPAQDTESDDDLRARVLELLNNVAFGGNISDYINKIKEIDGVGTAKIFPEWNGGGTVLASVVDTTYNPISAQFIALIKEQIDPVADEGEGVGTAPIGHVVTITTPTEDVVDISMTVSLESGVTITNVREEIEANISAYFDSVRKNFGQNNTLAIYIARIITAVLDVPEVLNVTDVELNGSASDIIYTDTEAEQYLPKMGDIIIA